MHSLRKRAEFGVVTRTGRKFVGSGFILYAHERPDSGGVPILSCRFGFTVSKKNGKAVARNRARRRLKEMVRSQLSQCVYENYDYVLIARPEKTASIPFQKLCGVFCRALRYVHKSKS